MMWNMGMGSIRENWFQISSMIASFMFVWGSLERFISRVFASVNPNIRIKFEEKVGRMRSEAYAAIDTYLGTRMVDQAKELKGYVVSDTRKFVITIGETEEVCDTFKGVKLRWASKKSSESSQTHGTKSGRGEARSENQHFELTFRRKDRDVVMGEYLNYLLEEAKAIESRSRKRKLYTNISNYAYDGNCWSHIDFKHPSTFETLAMDTKKKQEIISDLKAFSEGEGYYAKIGKAWKRGYLLFGPPGTGKSTIIAAIANYMDYDIYDMELTAVGSNAQLRKLLIDTSSKSLIVIEDIDCSVDLTGKRQKKRIASDLDEVELEMEFGASSRKDDPKVTLSGLLNFIDGLWSACGSERIIIFTTNYVDQLDPALIRRGRMDLHIEMSYCKFESFEVLAKNYLDIDDHPLFDKIEKLLVEVEITPADVGETLMRKSKDIDAEQRLEELIQVLEATKAKKKHEHEAAKTQKLKEKASVDEGKSGASNEEEAV